MKNYIEETLKFIESEEMRDYLRACPDFFNAVFRGWSRCAEIVSYAPAPIEVKIPVLELIAEQTTADPDWDYNDPAKLARESRIALDERYNTPPGTMFWLRDWYYHKEGGYLYDTFFTEFDAAIRYIREQQKESGQPDDQNFLSYSIDKYIPGENGILEEYCHWILNLSGDIWYFHYSDEFEPNDWEDLYNYIGELNLPVPFQPGDIILADCRPFAKERRVLIVDIGDNADCCAVQCLSVTPNGELRQAAFKHSHYLDVKENSHFSGLYRAARWHGEAPEEEYPLAVIGAAIKDNPGLWKEMEMFMGKNERYDFEKEADNDYHFYGVTWKVFRNAFGL